MPRLFLSCALSLLLASLALSAGASAQDQGATRKSLTFQPVPRAASPAIPPSDAPQPAATAAEQPATETPAKADARVQSGPLECRGATATAYGFGSSRSVTCEYRPASGQNQYYAGTLNRAGLDFGVSDQPSMLWMVLATSQRLGPGALAGEYVDITSGAAIGSGFSANVLMAKDATAGIALQPLSLSSDSGLSISLAAASLTLQPSSVPKR